MTGPAPSTLTVRPGRIDDRAALLALDAGGTGSLRQRGERLDAWLRDRSGAVMVAEDGAGDVVGTARLVRHGPDEWWLQGVRVAERARGRGVAAAVWDGALGLADDDQLRRGRHGALRLCCDWDNVAGHRLARRSGCVAVGDHVRLVATIDEIPGLRRGTFRSATRRDAEMVRHLLDADARFRRSGRLVFSRPVVARVVDEHRLTRLIVEGTVHLWCPSGSRREPVAVAIHETRTVVERGGPRRELVIGAFAARDEHVAEIASDLFALADELGCDRLSSFVPDDPPLLAAFGDAGWAPLAGGRGTIYRRTLGADR